MPRWTPETRQKQAEAVRQWLPWTKSTGPRTAKGKARSARNAWKGGQRVTILHWNRLLRQMEATLKKTVEWVRDRRAGRSRRKTGSLAPLPTMARLPWNAFPAPFNWPDPVFSI